MSTEHPTGDPELDRMIEEIMDMPDPPETPPVNYDAMSLAELLDDLVSKAEQYGLSDGFDVEKHEVEAARKRVDAAIAQLKAALEAQTSGGA